MVATEHRLVTALVNSALLGLLLAATCVGATLAHWAVGAWDGPRSWRAATVATVITSGGLLLALTITRFALLSENGG
jgi:hypothetical protein